MNKLFLTAAAAALLLPAAAHAHGDAGNRTFPATMAIDDPGVGDEVTFPQVSYFKETEDGATNGVTEAEFEWEKTLTDKLGISIGGAGVHEDSESWGMSNVELGVKYNFYTSDAREFMLSAGLEADIGGSGTAHSGAEDYTTLTPTLYAGKGLNEFDNKYLKAIALTGQLGLEIPTDRFSAGERNPDSLTYGGSVQYQMPYLEWSGVDTGHFWGQLTPIVEFNFQTPVDGDTHATTGTIQPGVIWQSDNGVQVGLEAILPATSRTGHGVGGVAQLHFYLDDLIPNAPLAKPVW